MMKRFLVAALTYAALVGSAMSQAIPPTVGIPRDEVVQPGTMAEAKAERTMGYGPKNVKVPDAWELAKNKFKDARGKNVRVVVLDTGIDAAHPWLKDRVKGQYNAINKTANARDGNGHGTHCAGTVLEALPDCDLYAVKVLSDQGSGSVVDIAHGVDYAVTEMKADVISLSLGGPGADSYIPAAFARAEAAGVLILCAAGNEGPGQNTDGYPARYKEAISIAASDANNKIANFSSRGKSVFTCTPGVNITSSLPGGRQGTMSGTSMATPLAAALAGLWVSCHPEIKKTDRPAQFRVALRSACGHPDTRNTDDGYGLPDATKLVGNGSGPGPVDPPPSAFKYTITFADLSAARQAELRALGITEFTLTLGGSTTGKIPVPSPMPETPTPTPPSESPNCPGGVCPTGQGVPSSGGGLFPNFRPFGGALRPRGR